MKKNIIAVMLSIVMALGSVGTAVPAFAAEEGTTAEAAVEDTEEDVPEDVSGEEDSGENTEDAKQSDSDGVGSETEDDGNAYIEDDVSDDGSDQVPENQDPASEPEEESAPNMETQEVDEEAVDESQDAAAQAGTIASGKCGANLTWALDGKGTLTISGTGAMDDYDGYKTDYKYSGSSPWFENRESVHSVAFPSGITHIGNYAFFGCSNLDELTIPANVTSLGYCMIMDTSIQNIIIPKKVSSCSIYEYFNSQSGPLGGSNVTKVEFEDGMKTIPDNICIGGHFVEQFQKVPTPETIIQEVVIPDSVTTIGTSAFSYCEKLSEVKVPSSVTKIGASAFAYCTSLSKATLEFDTDESRKGYAGLIIESGVFTGCSALSEQNMTENAVSIGQSAFWFCGNLTEVISSAKTVDANAFMLDNKLKTVVFKNVESLGASLFGYNGSNDTPNWPAKVSEIKFTGNAPSFDENTFSGCTLTAYYPESNRTWTSKVLQNYGGNITWTKWKATDDMMVALDDQYQGLEGKKFVISANIFSKDVIPSNSNITWNIAPLEGQTGGITWGDASVTDLGENRYTVSRPVTIEKEGNYKLTLSFGDASETAEVKIQSWKLVNGTLTIYGKSAMKEYTDAAHAPWYDKRGEINHIVIEDEVDLISSYAFADCSNVQDISIKGTVKTIGDYAFKSCYSLKNPGFKKGLLSIGGGAYQNCYSINNVTIPSTVREMGENPFVVFLDKREKQYPTNISLEQISVEKGNQFFAAEDGVLFDLSAKKLISYPAGRKEKIYAVPNTIKVIGAKAFANCGSLEYLSVTEQVIYIGDFAFASYASNTKSYMSVKAVCFMGNAPGFAPNSFYGYNRTANYMLNNATWTSSVMKDYGGTVNWECDRDLDGISDGWECCGADIDNDSVIDLDFPQMGASVEYPDVFVEVDWMRGYEPMASALNRVCEKFDEHGIHLHIDAGPNSVDYVTGEKWGQMGFGGSIVPYSEIFYLENDSHPYGNWIDTYNAHSGPNRDTTFHHFFFVNRMCKSKDDKKENKINDSGGTIPGGQLCIVADCDGWISGRNILRPTTYGKNTAQAGTFMHELGHSLGLNHASTTSAYSGGTYDADMSYQPNHLSVMNYFFQVTGFIADDYDVHNYDIDYSEYELPAIDERDIDETKGIDPKGVITNKNVITHWYSWNSYGDKSMTGTHDLARKSIDFNGNGSKNDRRLQLDLNGDGDFTVLTPSVNEWDILNFYSGCIGKGAALEEAAEQIQNLDSELPTEYTEEMEIERENTSQEEYYDPDPDEPSIIDSGDVTETVFWELDSDGVLTISGKGDMRSYEFSEILLEEGEEGLENLPWDPRFDDPSDPDDSPLDYIAPWFFIRDDIREIVVKDGVTGVGSNAFSYCENCRKVTLSDSVKSIGNSAFDNCVSLEELNWHDKIEVIDFGAFWDCDSLNNVVIPDNVRFIGNYAFAYCDKLKNVTLGQGANYDSGGMFKACKSLEQIVIPDGVEELAANMFEDCTSLKKIVLPESLTSIGFKAFKGCSGLADITIPESVTSIGAYAFTDCSGLKSLTIPNGVTNIDNSAFGSSFYWEADSSVILTQNPYVKEYCKENNYVYFDKAAPSITKLASYNGSDIRVYYEKRDFASGYQIKYADNKNMTNAKSVMIKDNKASSKVISGFLNGKTYYVQIQTFIKAGNTSYWSKWSSKKSVKIGQTPYPTNVSKLSTFIGSHIKVDWTKTAGASGYHIKYADNSSMTGAKEVMVKGNSTFTKTLTGLKNGKTYYVKIQTYRTVSGKTYWSSWSPAKSIKVDQKPYGSSISKLTNPSSKAMKITWDKAPSATGYHIQYAANSSMTGAKDITINNKDTLSKTITGLTKGKTYYVRIQTFRKVSGKTYWSSWSKAKQIKITK